MNEIGSNTADVIETGMKVKSDWRSGNETRESHLVLARSASSLLVPTINGATLASWASWLRYNSRS